MFHTIDSSTLCQRRARTGRVCVGYYFPLINYKDFNILSENVFDKTSSIFDESIDNRVLSIYKKGYTIEVMIKTYFDEFPLDLLRASYHYLVDNGLIALSSELTTIGKCLAIFPPVFDISLTMLMLSGALFGVFDDAIILVGLLMLSQPSKF